ncbi:MAG: chloramphenicol phosphotransferase [Devosia sp.]|uniref:phosphotransferase-like protein n=1 Tax=Devosia sp. TaxID=1871048 RepID=UPI0024CDBA69|nr:chloramphenicol phosphotransferase [Devosia sp.]UYN98721.1 MAG: chloramphenicol phosphotransferase [Devosia sp.]
MAGRIVILNGAPRSGKSSLAKAVQAEVPGRWVNWGVDAFNATLPETLFPGIGLRPGGERPDLEPTVKSLFAVYASTLVALAAAGFDVVADLGLHRHYASPFDPGALLDDAIGGLTVLRVGVDCDLDTIMARRNADPGSIYAKGDEAPPPVLLWQSAVHDNRPYDLRLDMGHLTPSAGAAKIAARMGEPAHLGASI